MPFAELLGRRRSTRRRQIELRDRALQILAFVGLDQDSEELAMNLPHGKQRLLSLAVALATQPLLLLLDEPVTGMNAQEIETLVSLIKGLRENKGITSIVVEHNMKAVMGLCDRIGVLNFGRKIAEGSPREIAENTQVVEAYLGIEEDVA